jgi:hypothetical protein
VSIASILLWCGFLVFFLLILPVSIYLFAKWLPNEYPGFIGFPEKTTRSTAESTQGGFSNEA